MSTDEKRMQDSLRELEANLDAATLSKLAQARSSALERPSNRFLGGWRAFGGLGLVSVLALMFVLPMQKTGTSVTDGDADLYDNLEFYSWMVESEQTMEDLQNNIDFYQWLADNELREQSQS